MARDSRPSNAPRRRWIRAAKIAGLLIAGLYAVYLVGMNVFLSTSLFERTIDATPLTIDIHYRRGWSVWPGLIHARDLSIRSRDSNVELMLRIDEVRFQVSFLGLAHKRFEASHVRGKGVSFRLRQRIDWLDLSAERLAGLPPIAGVPAVPVRPYRQCSMAEWSDAPQDYYLWTVHLEDVVAEDTREVWIDKQLLEGPMTVRGRFYLKPLRAVEVGPASAELHGVRMASVGQPWLEGLDGTADVTISPFDPRRDEPTPLDLAKVRADLRGVAPDVGRLPIPLPDGARLQGAVDLRKIAVRLEGGALRSGSRVEAAASVLFLEKGDDKVNGALAVTGDVGDADRVTVKAVVADARLSRGETRVAIVPRLGATADFDRVSLSGPVKGGHIVVDAREIDVPDVRALAVYLPGRGLEVEGGQARADVGGQAWIDEGRAEGRASMQAEDLDLRAGKMRARGNVTAAANVKSYEWRVKRLLLDAEAKIDVHVVAPGDTPDKGLTGDLRAVVQARSLQAGESLDLSGTAVAMRNVSVDGAPEPQSRGNLVLQNATFSLSPPDLRGVLSADVTEATPLIRDRVPATFRRLAELPRLLASGRLTFTGERMRVDDIDARGGSLAVRGLFGARGRRQLGAFVIESGALSVGIQVDPDGAHVRLFGLDGWLEEEKARVGKQIGP